MKKWQKIWLVLVIVYSVLHLFRDIFQDLNVKNFLSTILIKSQASVNPFFRNSYTTYLIEVLEISFTVLCFRRNKFGRLGYLTVFIAIFVLLAWSYYWFFL